MELLKSSVSTAPPSIRDHLQQMVTLDNVPRKEKQFRNFANNSLNLRRGPQAQKILDAIWNHLHQSKEQQQKTAKSKLPKSKEEKEEQQVSDDKNRPDSSSIINTNHMSTNNITDNEANAGNNQQLEAGDPQKQNQHHQKDDKDMYKRVKKATKKLLQKAPGKSMKYKSLQKAVRKKIGTSKEALKELMKQVVAKERKKFLLEGKELKLILD